MQACQLAGMVLIPIPHERHENGAIKLLCNMLTRQAVHMTLPVPEQKGQVSSPQFLAVVWATLMGTLPLPAQLPHVK